MTEDQMLEKIIAATYSKKDFLRRIRLLRQFFEQKFFSGKHLSLEEFLKTQDASEEDIKTMTSWGEDFYKPIARENLYNILNSLTSKMKNIPKATLYVPFRPNDEVTIKLGKWFHNNLNPKMIIDMRVDPEAVGGCGIVWQGIYNDYSIKYYLHKMRNAIVSIIDEYDKPEQTAKPAG